MSVQATTHTNTTRDLPESVQDQMHLSVILLLQIMSNSLNEAYQTLALSDQTRMHETKEESGQNIDEMESTLRYWGNIHLGIAALAATCTVAQAFQHFGTLSIYGVQEAYGFKTGELLKQGLTAGSGVAAAGGTMIQSQVKKTLLPGEARKAEQERITRTSNQQKQGDIRHAADACDQTSRMMGMFGQSIKGCVGRG